MMRFLVFLLLAARAALASAQAFPAKPIELVNAFAPGGANDLNARALQVSAQAILGQPLVQTFRQGGGGVVGTSEVAHAAPDGYKLLIVTSGELTAAPNLNKTAYSLDSFAFIARISSRPYGVVVRAASPWKSAADFLRAAAADPGKYTIGTTPSGGMFLTAQYFLKRGGIALSTVPFGGAGPALTALLGGHIDSVWAPLAAADSHIRAGTMRVLGVSGAARVSDYPDVTSFRELGIDSPFVQWTGIVAPKGVPAERLSALREGFRRITADAAYLETAKKLGIDVAFAPAEEFEKQVRDEDVAFKALVKDLGLSPQ